MTKQNWRDAEEFAELYPVIAFLDRPAAVELRAQVNDYCFYLASMLGQVDGYRQAAQGINLASLAVEHGFLVALADEMQQSNAPVPQLAYPAVCDLRDILAAEGLRRGHILHAGDVSDDKVFAACVVLQLTGPMEG